ncbi:TPA: hypothetical protein KV183_000164 [Morganella morganii]|uniref:Uncharacterized protein n=1 Tax=Morganella morganii TaxID=582 RepID=A0AAN5MF41_MORMO|nr:hypothetical protein [Morganella morganii]HAT3808175.1 hypothetical protein [Morganella morganii]HBH7050778.1 hypothetical protein [Morganella morganii]
MLTVYESVTVSFNSALLLSAAWYQLVILVFFRLSAGAESFFFVFGILSGRLQPFMYRGHMLKIVCFIAVILLSGCAGVGIGASGGSEGVSAGIGTGIGF